MQFFKDKFEFMVVTFVLLCVFWFWVQSDYRPDIKEFVIIISGAWLALLRVVQKPSNVQADTIQTDSIDTAKTQSGDIISGNPPKTSTKE